VFDPIIDTCLPMCCLRAMFPTQSPAAISSALAFCATYTTKLNTATTGFPNRATGGCGTSTARYSSACSCKPTTTSSTTLATSTTSATSTTPATSTTGYLPGCSPISSNNLVQNGGFECLYWVDWSPKDVANTYHIDTTGQNSYTSYEFKLRGNPASTTEVASLSQDVPGFTVGASYVLNYGSCWSTCDQSIGFIDIKLNYQSVTTIHPCQGTVAGLGWVNGTFGPFTAVSNVENLRFEFVLSLNQNNDDIRLDNIAITPA